MSNECAQFEPNELQLSLLKVFEDADYDITDKAACEQAGISRRVIYKWFAKPEFREWWTEKRNHRGFMRLHQVDRYLGQSASGKNRDVSVAACKLLLERFDADYSPQARQSVTLDSAGDLARLLGGKLGGGGDDDA